MRFFILPLLVTCAWAADPIGQWRFGVGTIDGQPATVGTIVLTGQEVVAADAAPLRLVCHEAPGITAILAAGSHGRFAVEPDGAGGRLLVLDLAAGAVQMDVTDKAPYSGVRVRGAALDVRVTGTLFVVERTRRDADYVALARGTVKVGLRPEVARGAGKAGDLEVTLNPQQGVAGDTTNGVGTPSDLVARPQIHLGASLRAPIADQGSGASDQGTPWDIDLAAELTGWLPDGGGPDEVVITPFMVLAEDLADSLAELGTSPESVGDQASASVRVIALPLPPRPPK